MISFFTSLFTLVCATGTELLFFLWGGGGGYIYLKTKTDLGLMHVVYSPYYTPTHRVI